MYVDNKPCEVCGAEIELSPAGSAEGTSEPDGTIDKRTCTNPECTTRRPDRRAAGAPDWYSGHLTRGPGRALAERDSLDAGYRPA